MPWLRLDDAMGSHRKTKRVLRVGGLSGLAAFGTHVLGLLHSAQYLTDGHVEEEFVEETFDLARLPNRSRGPLLETLHTRGLWMPGADGGWELHDYLDYNPSRAHVEQRRKADAERKANGRRGDSA